MSVETNPYSPPQYFPPPPQLAEPGKPNFVLASKGARFANFFVDSVVLSVIHVGMGFAFLGLAEATGRYDLLAATEGWPDYAIGFGVEVLFYVAFEGLTGITLGKLLTGTVVVNDQGQAPTFGQIVGRSFARLIPFEPFSFLGAKPEGWHDTLSKTHVVKRRSLAPAW